MGRTVLVGFIVVFVSVTAGVVAGDPVNCYLPVEGGWRITIVGDGVADASPAEQIGATVSDARGHYRPLFPPADKRLTPCPEEHLEDPRRSFCPSVTCGVGPHFMLDLHKVWGRSGYLQIGMVGPDGAKWFTEWDEIEVSYQYGLLRYRLRDEAFEDAVVVLEAYALAEAVGMLVTVEAEGLPEGAALVWAYGGVSNYMDRDLDTLAEPDGTDRGRFTAENCGDDVIRLTEGQFQLGRDGVWFLRGGSSWEAPLGFGSGEAAERSAGAVLDTVQWTSTAGDVEKEGVVVCQQVAARQGQVRGAIVVGADGGNIREAIARPGAAREAALRRNRSIAERVVIDTPDERLNAAATMVAFSTEGIWGDPVYMHSAFPEWREPYIGWRNFYGPLCYGWADRVKQSIEKHIEYTLCREGVNAGAMGAMLGRPQWHLYDMNLVFFDMVRAYFDYTNDVELMRKVFPVLEGIAAWESRRLQPENEYLYESNLNTWISDGHWYIRGQCTTASAYMLNNYRFLAELAEVLGRSSVRYRARVEAIREAMQRKLWMADEGVFAEALDTLHNRQLHPSPELPTIYHSAEFGAASALQTVQMINWVEQNLRCEQMAGGGLGYWNSDWTPNRGATYLHTTYDFAHAEQFNYALAHYLVGSGETAYKLICSGHNALYNGSVPGGLPSQMHTDGRERKNPEFADTTSMWGRAVVEGMFGIKPQRRKGLITLTPQFPADWEEASIEAPHFGYQWRRRGGTIEIDWHAPEAVTVAFRLPLRLGQVHRVLVDGEEALGRGELSVGVDCTWLSVSSAKGTEGNLIVSYSPFGGDAAALPETLAVRQGDELTIDLRDYGAIDYLDPQGVLDDAVVEGTVVRGRVGGKVGRRLLFLYADRRGPMWLRLPIEIAPEQDVAERIWTAPGTTVGDLGPWQLVDLADTYNAKLTEVVARVFEATKAPPLPAHRINHFTWSMLFHSANGHPKGPSDAAWREKVGADGVGWTCDGIPFMSSKDGPNIAAVTLTAGFEPTVRVPMRATGKTLYLMVSGKTYPMQCHVVNVRVTLHYADHVPEVVDLTAPDDIGDCWGVRFGHFYYTPANGFENLGGRYGPAGSAAVDDLTEQIEVDTYAQLVAIPLREGVVLEALDFEAYANDVVFGLMGASILR